MQSQSYPKDASFWEQLNAGENPEWFANACSQTIDQTHRNLLKPKKIEKHSQILQPSPNQYQ